MVTTRKGCLSFLFPQRTPPEPKEEFTQRNYLLTKAEASFYHALQAANANQVTICPKVRMSDILYSPSPKARNRIIQKHIDFILCDPQTLRTLAAIELDDKSHETDTRKARDQFIDEVFQSANLKLFHVKVQYNYEQSELKALITNAITPQVLSAASTTQGKPPGPRQQG